MFLYHWQRTKIIPAQTGIYSLPTRINLHTIAEECKHFAIFFSSVINSTSRFRSRLLNSQKRLRSQYFIIINCYKIERLHVTLRGNVKPTTRKWPFAFQEGPSTTVKSCNPWRRATVTMHGSVHIHSTDPLVCHENKRMWNRSDPRAIPSSSKVGCHFLTWNSSALHIIQAKGWKKDTQLPILTDSVVTSNS